MPHCTAKPHYIASLFVALTLSGAFEATAAQLLRAYVVEVHEPVRLETARVVERVLEIATTEAPGIVILHVVASGGRMDAAQSIVQDVADARVPVFSLVTAPISGPTALAALATDSLYVGPNSSMGAAASSLEMRGDAPPDSDAGMSEAFQAAVLRRGVNPEIAAAMIDPSISIPGVVEAGELLVLEPKQAVRLGVAVGHAADVNELLAQIGVEGAEVVTVDSGWIGTTIMVSNRNFREVVIYVVRSGSRFRLGMVTSMQSAQFDVPGMLLVAGSLIQIVAEVVGSPERVSTDEISVQPGLVVEWVIENEIVHSNYFVYTRP